MKRITRKRAASRGLSGLLALMLVSTMTVPLAGATENASSAETTQDDEVMALDYTTPIGGTFTAYVDEEGSEVAEDAATWTLTCYLFETVEDSGEYAITLQKVEGEGTKFTCPTALQYQGGSYNVLATLGTGSNYPVFRYAVTNLTEVIFPEGVVALGDYSLGTSSSSYCCQALTSLSLPNTLKEIGMYGLAYTGYYSNGSTKTEEERFHSLTVPDSVETLGTYAFAYCGAEELIFGEDSAVTALPNYCFRYAQAKRLILPGHVELLNGTECLARMENLDTISIPATVTNVGSYLFYYSNVRKVVFEGDFLESLGQYTFQYARYLEEVTLPVIGKQISGNTFQYTGALQTIYFKAGYETVENMFANTTVFGNSSSTSGYNMSGVEHFVFLGNMNGYTDITSLFETYSHQYADWSWQITCYSTLDCYENAEEAEKALTATRTVYGTDGETEYTLYGDNSSAIASVSAKTNADADAVLSGEDTESVWSSTYDPNGKIGYGAVPNYIVPAGSEDPGALSTFGEYASNYGYVLEQPLFNNLNPGYATIDTSTIPTKLVSDEINLDNVVVTSYDGSAVLTQDIDYTIEIRRHLDDVDYDADDPATYKKTNPITKAGTYTLIFTGTGRSAATSQTMDIEVTIDNESLAHATIDMSGLDLSISSGDTLDLSALKVIAADGTVMSEDSYTVTVTNASGNAVDAIAESGVYTITVTGKDAYADTSVSTKITFAKGNTTELEETIAALQSEIDGLLQQVDELLDAETVDEETIAGLRSQVSTLTDELNQLESNALADQETITKLNNEIATLNAKIAELEKGNTGGTGSGAKTKASSKQTIKLAKKSLKVKAGKKATVKVKNAKGALTVKLSKKVKKALKIKAKGKNKLVVKANKKAKKGKTYKIKVSAKAASGYAASNVVTLKVKVK